MTDFDFSTVAGVTEFVAEAADPTYDSLCKSDETN